LKIQIDSTRALGVTSKTQADVHLGLRQRF